MLTYCLNYFSPLSTLARARQYYRRRHVGLPAMLDALLVSPLPKTDCPISQLSILSLDFETTGLDGRKDHILSIGSVVLKEGVIELGSAQHNYVNQPDVVKAETAVINQLMPEQLAAGQPLDELMSALFERMVGQILLAHGSTVERRFIDAYLYNRFGLPPLPLPWLDTLTIGQRRQRRQRSLETDFRLSSLRQQVGLPDYPAHDALFDAVAAAELLLAFSTRLIAERPMSLAALLHLQGNKLIY
ncbi:DNA polymerase-3 subunit epsilon [Serratia fonticola]|uniref:DNA polymerase-3 subunit epsilon n=1 Tax=Serratia fonticola TaxID=47917 RepID=A0A542BTX3_SERFO|nr:3'-5' exonuclease [Serratia fonticola]TQI82021.1 DNA polymerase-3 subunit epsilon [Serratia fonticola]TQI95957.1 DNA polymerase-3 subunit epsilon [Serratia fonticola]TVZ70453.1 DNA polymerase-3 subunit epsilon [Serratia fonticola]